MVFREDGKNQAEGCEVQRRRGSAAILLSGPAGIGKSRLAAEAGPATRIEGWNFVEVDAGGSAGRSRTAAGWRRCGCCC